MGPIASRAPAQRHNCVWRVYWGEGGQLNSKTSSCRARLFNFTFPGFPAIHYFQAKIVSSILGGLAPISYLHASSGTSSPPCSGLQCHLLQEAHLSQMELIVPPGRPRGTLCFFLSSTCTVRLLSLSHGHTVSPSGHGLCDSCHHLTLWN